MLTGDTDTQNDVHRSINLNDQVSYGDLWGGFQRIQGNSYDTARVLHVFRCLLRQFIRLMVICFFALRFRLLQGMLDALAGAKPSTNSHQTWECLFFLHPGKTDMTKWKISLFLILVGDAS